MTFPLPRNEISVRDRSERDDLDDIHRGDPRWWGATFVREMTAILPPGMRHAELVAEVDDVPVAEGAVIGVAGRSGGRAPMSLHVRADMRGRGLGRLLLDRLLDQTQQWGLPGAGTDVDDRDSGSLDVVRRWGFDVAAHHRESVLDLRQLDVVGCERAVGEAERQGYRFVEVSTDDPAFETMYEHLVPLLMSSPDNDTAEEPLPLPLVRGLTTGAPPMLAVYDGDTLAGLTLLMPRERDEALNTMFTGVVPEHRQRGLATALKAEHALRARASGHTRIFTQNMDGNAPILAANDRLGFRPDSGYYELVIDLTRHESLAGPVSRPQP